MGNEVLKVCPSIQCEVSVQGNESFNEEKLNTLIEARLKGDFGLEVARLRGELATCCSSELVERLRVIEAGFAANVDEIFNVTSAVVKISTNLQNVESQVSGLKTKIEEIATKYEKILVRMSEVPTGQQTDGVDSHSIQTDQLDNLERKSTSITRRLNDTIIRDQFCKSCFC